MAICQKLSLRPHRFLLALLVSALPVVSPIVANAEAMTKNFPPEKFCDAGMFVLANGDIYSFEDIILEANRAYKLNESGPITAYGYVSFVELPSDIWGRIDASFFAGDTCFGESVADDVSKYIDLIVDPRLNNFSQDEYKEVKRTMLRSFDWTHGTALLKITGEFKAYSNTGRTYFNANKIEVLDAGKN